MAGVYVNPALCSRMLHFIVATAGMLVIGWLVFRLLQRQERQSGDDRPKGPLELFRALRSGLRPPGGGGTRCQHPGAAADESAAERKGASVGPKGR